MITGISFGDIHSYDDLGLYLAKDGINIPPATPKTNYVDVPGGDGSLDLSEAHGEVKYHDRECSFTFVVPLSEGEFEEKKTEVSNLINGRNFKITLDRDEEYFYFGRCSVNDYASDKRIRTIVINARVKPYKLKQQKTVRTFALTTEAQTVILPNTRKTACPVIECSADNTMITFGNATFALNAGIHEILDIQLVEGSNAVTVSGTGTVTFTYQEGAL